MSSSYTLIGGLRFRPADGPFTFIASRDSVKDSLLSYAGARDPPTGTVWGGVVSNTGTMQLRWDPSPTSQDTHIGSYISGGGSILQGRNVPNNWQAFGNVGLYGEVLKGFNLGVDFSGMHYDQNFCASSRWAREETSARKPTGLLRYPFPIFHATGVSNIEFASAAAFNTFPKTLLRSIQRLPVPCFPIKAPTPLRCTPARTTAATYV